MSGHRFICHACEWMHMKSYQIHASKWIQIHVTCMWCHVGDLQCFEAAGSDEVVWAYGHRVGSGGGLCFSRVR